MQSDRDTNALIAYHHEVSKDGGFGRYARKTLHLFGMLTAAAAGAYVGGRFTGPAIGPLVGAAAGAGAESGIAYLFDVATRLDQDWKPMVFGNWARDQVQSAVTRAPKK
jgi:hypothetical protein